MSDTEFMAWLRGYCYAIQGEGYGQGIPPDGFAPIIPYFKNEDGTIDRAKTLDSPSFYRISSAEKKRLLNAH